MPLPEQGVENHRRAALTDIVKGRNEVLVKELTEGGASAEDIAALAVKVDEPVGRRSEAPGRTYPAGGVDRSCRMRTRRCSTSARR
jgi:hypothetical protein